VARVILRLVTLVLSISLVVILLGGSFWYVWETARGRTPQIRYSITAKKLERAILGYYLRQQEPGVSQPANPDDSREVTFVVESGETLTYVAQRLERVGLVSDAELFRRVVQYWGADRDIEAGVYSLRPSMTMDDITRELQHGQISTIPVTVPEGWRAEQVAGLLEGFGIVSAQEFMGAVQQGRSDYDFLGDRPPGSPASLEGYLFPDTYQFPEEATPNQVLDMMLMNWDRKVSSGLRAKAEEERFSLYELLALASIVEREAVLAEERPLIAGVYLNRLDREMYLQSDPTVQYAKGYSETTQRWWNHMIQEEAVTVVSAYNTFLHPGLPPGPICSPGLAAIRAVLEPAATEYLFFYHKGDGSHAFALTYEEHLHNEEIYGGRGQR